MILLAAVALTGFMPGRILAQAAPDAKIQRGKYLVENVAMCGECHTPRNAKGELDHSAWLQGNLIDFKPDPPRDYASVAPPIAGMPGFTDEKGVTFLETGIDATGKKAQWPMPQFRFNHDDAVAVVAYLRSLKP